MEGYQQMSEEKDDMILMILIYSLDKFANIFFRKRISRWLNRSCINSNDILMCALILFFQKSPPTMKCQLVFMMSFSGSMKSNMDL